MGPGLACAKSEQIDYDAYLDFLEDHGHNFIRLWRWEQFRSQAAGGEYHLCMTPQPWARTGPGTATHGKPKFDLIGSTTPSSDRLRDRVIAAGNRGIYVAVMLFDGWALHLSPRPTTSRATRSTPPTTLTGSRFVSIFDYQVLPLDPASRTFQEAYIRRWSTPCTICPTCCGRSRTSRRAAARSIRVRAVLGLDRARLGRFHGVAVLGDRHPEALREQGYDVHPIGMTMQFPVRDQTKVNAPLSPVPPNGSRRVMTTRSSPTVTRAARSSRELVRRPTGRGWAEGRDHRHRPLSPPAG